MGGSPKKPLGPEGNLGVFIYICLINQPHMNISELKAEAIRIIKEIPALKSEIQDLYSLALSEIEEGGSESHECSLALSDMEELVKEHRG